MNWTDINDQRDANGNLTLLALAVNALGAYGCNCDREPDEPGTCLPCLCEAALKALWEQQTNLANRVALLQKALPTKYVEGEWVVDSEGEPAAVITYTTEPSPETGHIGWCWWALGRMGDAESYEQAKRAAEAVIRKFVYRGQKLREGTQP